jgi:hypothetical protein
MIFNLSAVRDIHALKKRKFPCCNVVIFLRLPAARLPRQHSHKAATHRGPFA